MKTKLLFRTIQNCKFSIISFLVIFFMTVNSFSQSDGIDFDCGPNVTFSFNSQPAGEVNGYSYWTGGTDNAGTNDTYVLFVQFVNNEPRWEVHVDLGFAVDEFDAPVAGTFGILYFYSNVFNGVSPSCDVDWIVDSLVVSNFPCTSLTATCLGGPIGNCLIYYADADEDGSGSSLDTGTEFCSNPGVGYSLTNDDCDDNDPDRFPENPDICDGIDNDCDGDVDENIPDCNNGVILEYCNDAKTKILVCHNGKDICVSINALAAHEAHGDFLGSCTNARIGETDIVQEDSSSFGVVSWPNPTRDSFNIRMSTPNTTDKVSFEAFDINGRLIHSSIINGNEDYQFGGQLNSGIYFVRLSQADKTEVVKLIKQ